MLMIENLSSFPYDVYTQDSISVTKQLLCGRFKRSESTLLQNASTHVFLYRLSILAGCLDDVCLSVEFLRRNKQQECWESPKTSVRSNLCGPIQRQCRYRFKFKKGMVGFLQKKMNWESSFKIFSLKLKQTKKLDVLYLIAIVRYDQFFVTDFSARGSLMWGSRSARLTAVISEYIVHCTTWIHILLWPKQINYH